MQGLGGKRVVLTAAGTISRALAEAFLAADATVTITHASREYAASVAQSIGGRVTAAASDMASSDSRGSFVEETWRTGGIDILVNHQATLVVAPCSTSTPPGSMPVSIASARV